MLDDALDKWNKHLKENGKPPSVKRAKGKRRRKVRYIKRQIKGRNSR